MGSALEAGEYRLLVCGSTSIVDATVGNPLDGNGDNDWDDILAVRVLAWLQSDPTDLRVNNGQPVTRAYGWWFAPRNLRYEKNRIS